MRPILDDEKAIEKGFDPVEDEALDITRKTRAALAKLHLPKPSGINFPILLTSTIGKRLPILHL